MMMLLIMLPTWILAWLAWVCSTECGSVSLMGRAVNVVDEFVCSRSHHRHHSSAMHNRHSILILLHVVQPSSSTSKPVHQHIWYGTTSAVVGTAIRQRIPTKRSSLRRFGA